MKYINCRHLSVLVLCFFYVQAGAQQGKEKIAFSTAGIGWANNSVNVVVFRKNSLVSRGDTQYISFYDAQRYVVVAKRKLGAASWQIRRSNYQGNTADAHNTISMMVDGAGYLHLAWDHHNNALHYCRSIQPGSLELTPELPMTGKQEQKVSYPEFYRMPPGNLLFLYRDGGSGQGNLVVNTYNVQTMRWTQLYSNLIDGETQRNAYWQACIDAKGTIHISWVWRESPDVASNHDLCYARSTDGGKTWERSTGEKYQIPITAASAEYAFKIPPKSELINQTSMFADDGGNPYIATYWRDSGTAIPQYRIVYKKAEKWKMLNAGFRTTAFSLSGAGTKSIPLSRPQVIAWQNGKTLSMALIFRDAERGNKVSVAIKNEMGSGKWTIIDLSEKPVGSWEPSYDTELWKNKRILNLFVQNVQQVDGEGVADNPPQPVQVLEWKPGRIH